MLLDHLTDIEPFTAMTPHNSFFASSPAMVLPPQQPNAPSVHPSQTNGLINGNGPNRIDTAMPSIDPVPPMPSSLAGRKRSRGDADAPDYDGDVLRDGSSKPLTNGKAAMSRGDPVMGPGMTLIYPDDPAYAAAAESQSGTWVEERAERNSFQDAHQKRPSVTARKSQRVDSAAVRSDDLAQLVLPPQMKDVTTEPLVDEATRALGISWTRMDATEALRINQAAYSKWIRNHYAGLEDVEVWFENSAIPGYLVAARNTYSQQQAYYIFSHDLTEARLVTEEAGQLIPRLGMLPALHLAAPGGCIRAEIDPVTAAQNNVDRMRAKADEEIPDSSGMCAAHSMEMD